MWKPAVLQPISTMPAARIVSHGGAVFGFQATVVMNPEKNVRFSILINSEDGEIIRGLMYELLDHYLERPTQDWPAAWIGYKKEHMAKALASFKGSTAKPARVGPSLPLARYAGDFVDPWYGPMSIRSDKGKLRIRPSASSGRRPMPR